jgi:hypothetical protein
MKTMKSILIAATLICATVVSTMLAQQAAAPAYQWNVAVGDSVMIKRECVKYLTGETPSTWVYDKKHTVGQLGTKRFPEGVLLFNINSWVCEECIGPVNPQNQAAQAKQAEQAKAAEQAKQAEVAPKETEPVVVKEEAAAVIAAQEAAQPATEEVKQEEASTEAGAALEEKPEVLVEQVKGDSVKSELKTIKKGYDRFTIGVRGGASGLLHKVEQGNWQCGFDALLDLQYAHYWAKDGRLIDLGIITGLSIGYAQSGMKSDVNSQFTHIDNSDPSFPMHIDYDIRADQVKENDGQLQLEIPLMFSLIHANGLFFNIGPKFMIPVYTPFNQKITDNKNTYISAYFQEIMVPVKNEVITGMLRENQFKQSGTDNGNQFTINIMLGAEIGYEWTLNSGNSLGLGAYANYCLYNSFKNNTSNDPLINVTPPQGSSLAIVDVLSATKTYTSKLGFFDVGVKVAYHFNFPKKRVYKDDQLFE